MRRVGIVTDTTACLPDEVAAEYGIEVVPLFLSFGDQLYQDGMTAGAAEFYEALRTASEPATTAAPSPGAYAEAVLRAGENANAVLCVTVSRQFSVMYDAAVQGAAIAKQRVPRLDVRVLDSTAAAMSQGFIVLAAARAAEAGATIGEAAAAAEALMPRVQLLVVIDTLAYLARSGRVPRLVVWASSPLQVKPIVEFKGGKYRPISIVRTMPRATDRLFQAFRKRIAGGGALHCCVHHTNVPDRAEALAERVRAELQPQELYVREFTQVMGVHAGPGLLGVAFYTDPE